MFPDGGGWRASGVKDAGHHFVFQGAVDQREPSNGREARRGAYPPGRAVGHHLHQGPRRGPRAAHAAHHHDAQLVRFNPARLNENPVELQPSTPCILLCDKAVKLSNSNLIRARVMSNPLIVTCL